MFLAVFVLLRWPNELSEAPLLWCNGLACICMAQQSSPTVGAMVSGPVCIDRGGGRLPFQAAAAGSAKL
jgi:hypothetical protein